MSIEDFGKKIGGAKKDIWKERGLSISDLNEFNEAERSKYIKKDNVWKKPDYEQLVKNGLPVRVAYYIKLVRDGLPTKPVITYSDASEEQIIAKQEGFISFVSKMRDAAMALKTEDDVLKFFDSVVEPYLIRTPGRYYITVVPEAYDCITNKFLKSARIVGGNFWSIDRNIKLKQFCFSEDDKLLSPFNFYLYKEDKVSFNKDYNQRNQMSFKHSYGTYFFYPEDEYMSYDGWEEGTYFIESRGQIFGRNFKSIDDAKLFILGILKEVQKGSEGNENPKKKDRKKSFVPKQLEHIIRTGEDYRNNIETTGNDYLTTFNFRGGEFGNWLNEKERQASLDFGYDALLDLCKAINITPEDLSLGGRLSIAFGARGHAGALAHYEPLREVINLTKMNGAGSLAHEWAHALDDIVGKSLGLKKMMSQSPSFRLVPESFRNLINSLKYKEVKDDVALNSQKEEVQKWESRLRRYTEQFFSSNLDEGYVETKNKLIDKLIESAKGIEPKTYNVIFTGTGYPELDELSDFRKNVQGRVIPKQERIQIAHYVNSLNSAVKKIGGSKIVETDFYKNSKTFDSMHSKTDHGYWQSSVEMFARAFACYVEDKLKEMNIQSDYLCGHANLAISMTRDRSGNEQVIKAFPEGDERKTINRNFDLFFEELREKEILHPLISVPKVSELENFKEPIKSSLDDKINYGKNKIKENFEHFETKVRENSKGQLEFELF